MMMVWPIDRAQAINKLLMRTTMKTMKVNTRFYSFCIDYVLQILYSQQTISVVLIIIVEGEGKLTLSKIYPLLL